MCLVIAYSCFVDRFYCSKFYLRPQFVDTLLIVRLEPNMSMRRAVIFNYYFLVHKV